MTVPGSGRFVALLRGVNVGGKNLVAMGDVTTCLLDTGLERVRTHGQSGNVLFSSPSADDRELEGTIEFALQRRFSFPVPVVVRSRDELSATIAAAPADHGSNLLRSDVFFMKQPLTPEEVLLDMPALREGVDSIALGPGAIYFSRFAADARRTRITAFMAMPVFKQLTMRTWGTTTRLLELLDAD